ncbi:class I SAM-dependent DNA methyltransferase [Marinococcus luteus]|uniref:class I SAM-dependent DNA methyltransferase n=1 Tax=Marinococcus luteus TaxID=1122204 RepID=UPI002ACC468D|nr:methyltransferase domain-containing protein [Marinococcus luteus]MDZ5782928.1 methyltransferase domain-containing protein [Marinococcus luteus]
MAHSMYNGFAEVYDRLMADAPYDAWKEAVIKEAPANNPKMLELGCGTGEIMKRLYNEGFHADGMDLSADMLAVAAQKWSASRERPGLFHQDMRFLDAPDTYQLIFCFCDSLNYLTKPEDVKATFAGVYNHLEAGGAFMFDVHSIHYIEDILSEVSYADNDEEISFIWDVYPSEQIWEVEHELTIFSKNADGTYSRYDEDHVQRTFAVNEYKEWLEEAGFSTVHITADFTADFPDEESERIFFLAKKTDK